MEKTIKKGESKMNSNLILMTDSYKLSHYKQYPPKTTNVYSYFESRGGRFDSVKFFGLQYFIKKYLEGNVITQENVNEAKVFSSAHMGREDCFNLKGWQYIVDKHQGKLPIRIKAVPEGLEIPTHNVLMTVENTDPNCYWLTNYLETLLVQVWYPTTVCTYSKANKEMILGYLEKTGDPSLIDFKLHDFGYRGSTSPESAGLGAAAHLVNFMGTDTIAGIKLAQDYYGAEMCGFSIPAAEHSTITAWGRENEVDAMRNMLTQYPTGLVACVSDSFNIFKACSDLWGGELKDEVLARDGVLVVRPDSGEVIPTVIKVLEILGNRFGTEKNNKGYKLLNPKVRVIQSDGVDYNTCADVLSEMRVEGWSADNIAFGSGGGLLQNHNRDEQKFAFKCSSVTVDGEMRDVYKDPVTDSGKRSKKGRLALIHNNGEYETVREEVRYNNILETVFEDGKLLVDYTFDSVKRYK